jgi:DNA-binding NtrC family response regulator
LENTIERAVVLAETTEIGEELLAIDGEVAKTDSAHDATELPASKPVEELSLEDYFQRFVLEHQDIMNETQLAKKLGISRKCLWERRQRFGIPRRKKH